MSYCERCGGEGTLYDSRYGGNDPDVWPTGKCPVCEGSGFKPDECADCGQALPLLYPCHASGCPVPNSFSQPAFRELCQSCKQMYENGGVCADPVMRGGCPMGGDF